MSASKNQPPSPQSSANLPSDMQQQLNAGALLTGALSGVHSDVPGNAEHLPHTLLAADKVLRRAAGQPAPAPIPDGLAERTIAKCATLALDGSIAGEVVV